MLPIVPSVPWFAQHVAVDEQKTLLMTHVPVKRDDYVLIRDPLSLGLSCATQLPPPTNAEHCQTGVADDP